MHADRIGEILSRIIPLSDHDIEEILHEQRATHRPFGDIALAMGLCQPQDIWQAWSGQLDGADGAPRRIDLDSIGIDSQAIEFVSPEEARRWTAVPVRVFGDELVIAVDAANGTQSRSSIRVRRGLRVKFVLAERAQIERAIDIYYSNNTASAA
jgi:type IV pilus assembly protein PilB